MDRRTDGQMDGWTDGQIDRQTDGQTDGRTDGWTNKSPTCVLQDFVPFGVAAQKTAKDQICNKFGSLCISFLVQKILPPHVESSISSRI